MTIVHPRNLKMDDIVPSIEKRSDSAPKKIIVGLCAMEKKANSKPMKGMWLKLVTDITSFSDHRKDR